MVTRISVNDSEELRELIAFLKNAPKEVQVAVRAQTRRHAEPIIREEMLAQGPSRFERMGIVDTTRITVSEQNITAQAGATKGKFRNGLDARKSIRSMEFGSNGGRVTTYNRRSRKGGTHKVTRHTMRQFGSPRRSGRVFYPAVGDIAPRVASLWIQTVLRIYRDAFDRKG